MKTIMKLGALAAVASVSAWADSISPTSFSATLGVGDSVTVHKTVTVSEGVPTSSKVDVYFLADNTGSMGSYIAAVKASAASILADTAALGDVQFGVGRYVGEAGDSSFSMIQNLTANQAAVQAGINAWFASGGGDGPEANLYGLAHSADDTAWRAGSERIVVWFGDAPGHDPSPGGAVPSDGKVTEAQATAALLAKGINVQAIAVGGTYFNSLGQATRIAAATGGTYYAGIDSSSIVETIKDAIETVVSTYTTVALDLSEVPGGLAAVTGPGSYFGLYDRSVERTFEFDLTFTAVTPGTYSFPVYGLVDGGRVAKEDDRIIVTGGGGPGVPDGGSTMLLLGAAMTGLGLLRRRIA